MRDATSRFSEDIARLFNDATGLANGMRREGEALVRAQMERLFSKMDLVSREEFEAARDMAARAREENEALSKRLADLEKHLGRSEKTHD